MDPHNESVVVLRRTDVSDCVVELQLGRADGRSLWPWQPGAHLDLHLPGELTRQYSLCGDLRDFTTYRIAVLRERDGRGGSAYVHDRLSEGDIVEIGEPRNHFALGPASTYRFLAAGVGITPILAMIDEAERGGADWRLHYFGRSRRSMAYWQTLVERYPDRVEIRADDEVGAPDLPAVLGYSQDGIEVYACGPEGFLHAAEEATASWPDGVLHVERFAARPIEDAVDTQFTVVLAQSGLELEVPADRSIIRVLEDAGVTVIYSCLEGTCGTCEIPVLSGEVDHRDSILTPEEQRENSSIMPCVSRACSAVLELDI